MAGGWRESWRGIINIPSRCTSHFPLFIYQTLSLILTASSYRHVGLWADNGGDFGRLSGHKQGRDPSHLVGQVRGSLTGRVPKPLDGGSLDPLRAVPEPFTRRVPKPLRGRVPGLPSSEVHKVTVNYPLI